MNDEKLTHALPCPFCGGTDLGIEDWYDDRLGEFEAVFCKGCLGSAPFDEWNNRPEQAA